MGDSSESEPQGRTTEGREADETTGGDTLADAARDERKVAARRLRDDLNRDPTDAEIDEWLRQHTEGY